MPPGRWDEEPGIFGTNSPGKGIENFECVRQRKDASQVEISLTVFAHSG